MTVATMLRKPRRVDAPAPMPAPTARLLPHAEAPDSGESRRREAPEIRAGRRTEAPDAGDGRAALHEGEFTHGRSRS